MKRTEKDALTEKGAHKDYVIETFSHSESGV